MIKLPCQACAKILRFQEKYLGRKIHCPQCGHPQVLGENGHTSELPTQGPPGKKASAKGSEPSFATQAPDERIREPLTGNANRGAVTRLVEQFLDPPQEPDEIGRLGGYRILGQLGAGGMGIVFLAEDATLKRKIALKVLPPGVLNDATARDRFFREARAAAALEHENIITIHQVSEDHGVPFLAMPLLKGRSLETELRERDQRPLALDEVMQIGHEVAAGLAAAHDKGLVHRDIKPANIWLEDIADRSSTGKHFRVKILDFGLARHREGSSLTQSGIIVGTPSYMSPEQARNPNVDARSDLFSLGSVLYEIATGQRPFPGVDPIAILSSLAVDVPLPPAELNDAVPEELSELIMELLEKNPAHRPGCAREVVERLLLMDPNEHYEGGHSDDTTELPTRSLRLPRKKKAGVPLWMWAAPSAFVVLMIAATAFLLLSGPAAEPKQKKDFKDQKDGQKGFFPPPPPPNDDPGKEKDFKDFKDFKDKDFKDKDFKDKDFKDPWDPKDFGKKKKKEDWDDFDPFKKKPPPPPPPGFENDFPPPFKKGPPPKKGPDE